MTTTHIDQAFDLYMQCIKITGVEIPECLPAALRTAFVSGYQAAAVHVRHLRPLSIENVEAVIAEMEDAVKDATFPPAA